MSRQTRIIKRKADKLFNNWMDLFQEIEDINIVIPEDDPTTFKVTIKDKREE